MNKLKVLSIVIIGLIFVNTALADVPAPPVAQEIQIELAQLGYYLAKRRHTRDQRLQRATIGDG